MKQTVRFSLTVLVGAFGFLPEAQAEPVDFAREVQPILSEHCTHCHGSDEKSRKGDLRLDLREAALAGGKSDGAAITPGKPDRSALIARILSHDPDEVMPPPKEKKPVSAAQAEILLRWITEGAAYAKHWAFETPRKEKSNFENRKSNVARDTASGSGVRISNFDFRVSASAIDSFVRTKLESLELAPSPEADPATLCRRMHLDVLGFPPSPAEVAEFKKLKIENPDGAVAEWIAKLLKSPQFGEKWARHWLDAARYSDSNGYEKDLPREQWAWRDWVIKAFNTDMPYDQFLIEQLAGDLLPDATQDQIVATGFLRNSMVNEEGAIVPEEFRIAEIIDRLDCLGKATLGLSVQCAQCHTHKFDPISHDEYFGLFAFFNNAYEAQSWIYTPEQQKTIAGIKSKVSAAEAALKKQQPDWSDALALWEKSVQAKEIDWTPLKAVEMESTSGLNHPTQEADLSILTQGHATTNGDVYFVFEDTLSGATGLRLEALTRRDFPFNGPGRSKLGTWAISEMRVEHRAKEGDKWESLKLVKATADFSEPEGRLEEIWKAKFDPEQKRICGPVRFLIDGKDDTAWRADRGPGLRNQEGVAVVQFEQSLSLPAGTKIKITLLQKHGGDDNGRGNTQLGRCRISVTRAPNPQAQPVNYRALLAMRTAPAERTTAQQDAIFTAWRQSVPEAQTTNDHIAAEWEKMPEALTSVLHLAERSALDARTTKLLDRGAWNQPRHAVAAHVPAALHPLEVKGTPDRLDFARWVASEKSALTARVAVNRVWQALFGSGLVETSEDFGTRAPVPEYREVLDWLAVDFMENGWSHKHLIETILCSATYQQSSKMTPALLEQDPKNRLLTRGPRFRMEAEVIRDSALQIAGLLHQQVGGPSIYPPVPQSVLDFNYVKPTYWEPPTGPERYRRALYLFRKRSMPDPVLSSFDAPNGDLSCARRTRSNTPLSALTSWNETIFVEAAQAFAQRIVREGGASDVERITYAYQLCVSRKPTEREVEVVQKLLDTNVERLRQGELKAGEIAFSSLTKPESLPPNATPNDLAAWTIVGRVLLNLDETLTKG